MDVVSSCSLPVSSWLWRSSPATWTLTVICRATFLLQPTASVLAPDQEHPLEEDDHWNDDAGRSLRVASDLVPLKTRADVTLVGHAFAPRGTAVRSLCVRLLVGEIDKVIDVHGDRSMGPDGALEPAAPFSRMPLLYERAAGGPETWNPVGVRGAAGMYGRVALPNLMPHGLVIASPSDYIAPVGFGPIAPTWPSRREKLGRSAALGRPPNGQAQPLPDDLDRAFFNHAPRDQQPLELRENERIILENLHPEYDRLVTSLPGVRPRATALRRRGTEEVPLRCDTLWIDTDRARCALTWRGQVLLESPDEQGRIVFSLDGQVRAPEISASRDGYVALEVLEDAADTLVPAVRTAAPQLGAAGSAAETLIPTTHAPAASSVSVLPFVAASQAPPPPPPPRPSQPLRPPTPRTSRPPAPPTPPSEPIAVPQPPAWVSGPITEAPIAPTITNSRWSISDEKSSSGPPPMTVGQLASVNEPAKAEAPKVEPKKAEAPKVEPKKAEAPKIEAKRALQLLWFAPESLPPMRRKPPLQALLAALEDRPPDIDLEDASAVARPADMEDRRDVFEVMARGEVIIDEAKVTEAMERALREDGKFVPPFLLVDGELRLPFDELATLKATVSLASPFAAGDEPLKAAIAEARELLRTPEMMFTPGVFEGFTTLVQEAFRKMRRPSTPPTYLEEQAERVLLERRSFQKREVFGAPYVRALLTIGGAPKPWPLYLPEDAAKKLPMFTRFQARVFAEACLQEDQFEAHASALRAVALARLSPMTSKAPSKP